MVGTGRAAEIGVLFRGRPELTDLITASDFTSDEVLGLVGSVEARSEHPIGEAIVGAAKGRGLGLADVENFEATAGFGVSGRVSGRGCCKEWIAHLRNAGFTVTAHDTGNVAARTRPALHPNTGVAIRPWSMATRSRVTCRSGKSSGC